MRGTFYLHSARSEDDGRVTFYMATNEDGDGSKMAELTLTAPDDAFETFEEVPRGAHKYKATVKFELVDERLVF